MSARRALFLAPWLTIPAVTDAQTGAHNHETGSVNVVAHRTVQASAAVFIVVDGRLAEASWQTSDAATNFTQRQPRPGAAASRRTEARVLFDDAAIYIGMRLYDPAPDSIATQLLRRD